MNIQSVNAKFDEFQYFISRMNIIHPINATCLQECWLGDADNVTMFNLENNETTFLPKSCCAHGGLIIYVHKQFECRVMTEVVVQASGWEYLCVKVSHRKRNRKSMCCAIYIESQMKLLMIWILLLLNCLHCYMKLKASNILHMFVVISTMIF